MVGTGSSNSWFINRNNSSIGIIKKLSVEVKRSVIAVANISNRSSSNDWGSSISSFLGSKMISTCSSNSRLISRDNSSIRKTYKLCVQVERSSIAVASSSNSRNSSNNWGSSSISNSLGSKMISTGSSNSWFIKRNNSS